MIVIACLEQNWSTLFWMFLWECFWMRLIMKSVEWMKFVLLVCVGLIQSIEGLNRIKSLTLPWIIGNSYCLDAFNWDVSFFLRLKMKHGLSLGFEPASLWIRTIPTALLGLQLASLPCRSWDLSAYNHVTQFLKIHLFLYIYILSVLFLWRI